MGLEHQPMHNGFVWNHAVTQDFSQLFKSGLTTVGANSMTMDPYPHPQHMKDVKALVYVRSGGGIHSILVWSLNQGEMALFGAKQ